MSLAKMKAKVVVAGAAVDGKRDELCGDADRSARRSLLNMRDPTRAY